MNAIPWFVFSLLSAISVIGVEWINRLSNGKSWHEVLVLTLPLIVVAQFGLFQSWSRASHWFSAWVMFALGTAVFRAVAVRLAGQDPSSWPAALGGIALMFGGAFLVHWGLRG